MTLENLSNVSDFCSVADLSSQRARTLEALNPGAGSAFLDIGCGLGHLCRDAESLMGKGSFVIGIDKNWENVAFAASVDAGSCHYLQADALALPLQPASMDYATCIQAAEYIRDTRALVSNVQRVLRKGGKALFVCTDWSTMSWPGADPSVAEEVKDLWSKHCLYPQMHASLLRHFEQAGLVVEKSWVHTIRNALFDESQYSYGLMNMITSFASLSRNPHGVRVVHNWGGHLQDLHEQGKYDFRLDRLFHLVTRP